MKGTSSSVGGCSGGSANEYMSDEEGRQAKGSSVNASDGSDSDGYSSCSSSVAAGHSVGVTQAGSSAAKSEKKRVGREIKAGAAGSSSPAASLSGSVASTGVAGVSGVKASPVRAAPDPREVERVVSIQAVCISLCAHVHDSKCLCEGIACEGSTGSA